MVIHEDFNRPPAARFLERQLGRGCLATPGTRLSACRHTSRCSQRAAPLTAPHQGALLPGSLRAGGAAVCPPGGPCASGTRPRGAGPKAPRSQPQREIPCRRDGWRPRAEAGQQLGHLPCCQPLDRQRHQQQPGRLAGAQQGPRAAHGPGQAHWPAQVSPGPRQQASQGRHGGAGQP